MLRLQIILSVEEGRGVIIVLLKGKIGRLGVLDIFWIYKFCCCMQNNTIFPFQQYYFYPSPVDEHTKHIIILPINAQQNHKTYYYQLVLLVATTSSSSSTSSRGKTCLFPSCYFIENVSLYWKYAYGESSRLMTHRPYF